MDLYFYRALILTELTSHVTSKEKVLLKSVMRGNCSNIKRYSIKNRCPERDVSSL